MTRADSIGGGGHADLALVAALVVGTTAALVAPGVPRAIEWVLGVPFLLLVPGYALVAVVFPAGPRAGQTAVGRPTPPDWTVRLALALVGSVLVLAVVGVSLSLLGELGLLTAVVAIDIVVGVGTAIAWFRRGSVAVADRADPVRGGTQAPAGRLGLSTGQTLAFALAALTLLGAVAFVGATPAPTDAYSEVSLLDGEDGSLLGANGTVTLDDGAELPVTLRLENHEGADTSYVIVGEFQEIGPDGTVRDTWDVDRETVTVAAGERVDVDRQLDPPGTADRLALRYLVYTGPVPDEPSAANADLSVRQWIDRRSGGSA